MNIILNRKMIHKFNKRKGTDIWKCIISGMVIKSSPTVFWRLLDITQNDWELRDNIIGKLKNSYIQRVKDIENYVQFKKDIEISMRNYNEKEMKSYIKLYYRGNLETDIFPGIENYDSQILDIISKGYREIFELVNIIEDHQNKFSMKKLENIGTG